MWRANSDEIAKTCLLKIFQFLKCLQTRNILFTIANSRLVTFDRTEASKCEELKRRREVVEEAENWEDWDEWEEEEKEEEEE